MNAAFQQHLSRREAAQHLLNRRRAREDVVQYAGYIDVPGRPVSEDPECELFEPVKANLLLHHELVLQTMHRTSQRDYGRALIMMPPGSAKTSYASVVFPSWYLGKKPGRRLLLVTYGEDLARTMGHKTRSIVRQARYQRLFDVELTSDSRAADHFLLTNESEYHASGYAGDLPGRRAEGAICDDIIKGILEASSQVERDNVWNAYSNNLLTRLLPRAWLVIIMTHWDEDDPAGRILPDNWAGESGMFRGKDDLMWEVLCIQAQCESTTDPLRRPIGEYMMLEAGKTAVPHFELHKQDARKWNALFQQRPRPIEGAFFHENDLLLKTEELRADGSAVYKPCSMPRRVDYVYAIIDSAVKTGKQHDGLAVMFFARSILNKNNAPLTVLDWDLIQMKGAFLNEWLPTVFTRLEVFARDCGAFKGSLGALVEDKVSGTILLQQAERHPEWPLRAIESGLTALGKKERAISVSGHVAAGEVKWTEQAYTRTVTYKGSTRNHALMQVLRVSMDSKDTEADDCLDTKTYGIAIGLGTSEGY